MIDFGLSGYQQTALDAQRINIKSVGDIIHELALVQIQWPIFEDEGRDTFHFRDLRNPAIAFETYATEEFLNLDHLSVEFKCLLSRCMAVVPSNRPALVTLIRICERNIRAMPHWRRLADEVNELFDCLPDNPDDSDSDWRP
ncbi:hypothetical protein GGS21DRAFT_113223 [Xylaria nigripes]|nr:hypothetical protein GGS21DRAFT_113223 [Xylaria nigripes]